MLKKSHISRVALEEQEGFDARQLISGEVEGAKGGKAVTEGGKSSRGAALREKQVQFLLLEAGRLEAALQEEEVWPRGADGSCLAGWRKGPQRGQAPQPVAGRMKVLGCSLA